MIWPVLLVFLYCPVFIVTSLMIAFTYRLRHLLGYQALMASMVAQCFIAAMALAIYAVGDFETKVELSRLRFLGMSLLGPLNVIIVNSLFTRWRWLEKPQVLALFFVPAGLTWIFTLTPSLQNLVVTDFAPIELAGLSLVSFLPGAWFPWHVIASYIGSSLSVVICVYVFLTERGPKRAQVLAISLACSLVSTFDLYCILTNSPLRWMMIPGCILVIADIVLLYAGMKHQFFNIVPFATEQIFRNLPDPILVLNERRQVETANESALQLFGISLPDFGQKISTLTDARLFDQSEIWLQARHFEIVREPMPGTGCIIHLRETTEGKKTEKTLIDQVDFKSQMLSLIAHDVAGNLQAQSALMEAAKAQATGVSKDIIHLLVDSNSNLYEFLRNTINWEKAQHTNFQVIKRAFDLQSLVDSCLDTIGLVAKIRKVEVETHIRAPGTGTVVADSEVIAAVLRNLLSNAVRASRPGSKVRLQITVAGTQMSVEVSDEGAGISPEQLVQLLDDNQHPTISLRSSGGFGIGFYIVRRFIDLLEGKLTVDSKKGLGTQVRFTVPVGVPRSQFSHVSDVELR